MIKKRSLALVVFAILLFSLLLFTIQYFFFAKDEKTTISKDNYITLSRDGKQTFSFDFKLINQNNQRVVRHNLKNPYIVFFGFSYCPDICPQTLAHISSLIQALPPEYDDIEFYFITLDPKRDTQEQLALYGSLFHDRIQYLTGTEDEISKAVASFKVYRKFVF
jgi:cytochrome oxidase Cu insertion factor (SCO1/SenC/PrrC family)